MDNEKTFGRTISRRGFLSVAACGALATMGIAGCSPAATGRIDETASSSGNPSNAESTWRNTPDPIPDDQIAETLAADIVVVGAGHAGVSCARSAAENGASVILLDEQAEETYLVFGDEHGVVNSKYMTETLGFPELDKAEVYNDWMARNAWRSNPAFVKAYVDRSGETFDWMIEILDEDFVANFTLDGFPGPEHYTGEQNGQKTWASAVETHDSTVVQKAGIEKMLASGSDNKMLWGYSGEQIVKDGDKAVAVIAKNADGAYVRINANKGIVIATGGFCGNDEMCRDIYTNIVGYLPEEARETYTVAFPGIPRMGKGHQMCLWAGGIWEPDEPASMSFQNPCGYNPFNGVKSAFSNLWLNGNGERYTNEGGDFQIAGLAGRYQPQNPDGSFTVMSVFDSSLLEDLQYQQNGHAASGVNDQTMGVSYRELMQQNMQAVIDAGADGLDVDQGTGATYHVFAADTVEDLVERLGLEDAVAANFIASVERYNELCEKGYDEDFFKNSSLMRPLTDPPYFAYKTDYMLNVGLTTLSGMWTDDNQCCLDSNKQPIEGLYATGNVCGRRWIGQYSTSIAGQSLSLANTLGKMLGEHLAAK